MRDKVIRGKPIYVYKGSLYLEQPEGTIIKKSEKESNGLTYCYCKKRTFVTEILCTIIILILCYVNISYIHTSKIVFKYNNITNYYDGKLYININLNKDSPVDIEYIIKDNGIEIYKGNLQVGETCIAVEVDKPSNECYLLIQYTILNKTFMESYKLNVIDKSS